MPLGVLFVVAALGNWEWGPLRHDWMFVAVVLVIAAVCALINRYYNEHFGRVTPSTRQQIRAVAAGALGVALMIGLTTLLRSRASWSLDLPVNPIAAAFGLLMLAYYAIVVRLRTHHALVWGSLVVAGLLPVWNGADPSNVGLVLAGVAVVINGAFDHLLLVRTFGPATTATLGPGNAGG
jgi:heme O synthase-like polyprenyltransferase